MAKVAAAGAALGAVALLGLIGCSSVSEPDPVRVADSQQKTAVATAGGSLPSLSSDAPGSVTGSPTPPLNSDAATLTPTPTPARVEVTHADPHEPGEPCRWMDPLTVDKIISGLTVHLQSYVDCGYDDSTGKPVLLLEELHGTGSAAAVRAHTVPAMAKVGIKVTTANAPGLGPSAFTSIADAKDRTQPGGILRTEEVTWDEGDAQLSISFSTTPEHTIPVERLAAAARVVWSKS